MAVSNVKTKYTVICRGVVYFTWHSRIERLIRELSNLEAVVIAGAARSMSGLVCFYYDKIIRIYG